MSDSFSASYGSRSSCNTKQNITSLPKGFKSDIQLLCLLTCHPPHFTPQLQNNPPPSAYESHVGNPFVQSPFNNSVSLALNNLFHVPEITRNLISVSEFAKDNDVYFEFHATYCCV